MTGAVLVVRKDAPKKPAAGSEACHNVFRYSIMFAFFESGRPAPKLWSGLSPALGLAADVRAARKVIFNGLLKNQPLNKRRGCVQ